MSLLRARRQRRDDGLRPCPLCGGDGTLDDDADGQAARCGRCLGHGVLHTGPLPQSSHVRVIEPSAG